MNKNYRYLNFLSLMICIKKYRRSEAHFQLIINPKLRQNAASTILGFYRHHCMNSFFVDCF